MTSHPVHILCLGGSLRSGSYSLAACREAAEIAREAGHSAEVIDLGELNLPMYAPDWGLEEYGGEGSGVHRLIEAYRRADAVIWSSPTYHGTISGVFKNAIDLVELLSGDQPAYLQGRSVGLISINDSTTFAAMRDCARELRAWLAPTQVELTKRDFDGEQRIPEGRSRARIARLVGELAAFAAAHPRSS